MESTEKKPKPKGDPEINAIRNIDRILSAFEFGARMDILDFVRNRVTRRQGEQLQLDYDKTAAKLGLAPKGNNPVPHEGSANGQLFP